MADRRIMWLFADRRPRTLREIATSLGLEQSTINRQVNAAIKRGYVERFDVPGQVSRSHRPTSEGREAFEHDGLARVERLQRVFDDLAPGDPNELLRQLRAFNDAYERQSSRQSPVQVTGDPR